MELRVFEPCGVDLDQSKAQHATRLDDLNGKTIGEISNRLWESDLIFPLIRSILKERYPDIKFVTFDEFPNGAGCHHG